MNGDMVWLIAAGESVAEHPRKEGCDPGSRRGDGGEIDGCEQQQGGQRHVGLLALRLASVFSASTRDEKNIAA